MMLLVDIGGTHTRIVRAEKEGSIPSPLIITTPSSPDTLLELLSEHTNEVDAIALCSAGNISSEGVIIKSPNLPAFDGYSMKKALEDCYGTRAYVSNDAVAAGTGEAHEGAGKGSSSLLYYGLGTGIGASRIINGMPDLSVGSETGHQYLVIDGVPQEAESYISGKALTQRYGAPGEELRDRVLWKEAAQRAALPLYNTLLHFLPDTVVLGGSLFKEGSLSVEDLEKEVAAIATHLPSLPRFVHGTLGESAGLYGVRAIALAAQ